MSCYIVEDDGLIREVDEPDEVYAVFVYRKDADIKKIVGAYPLISSNKDGEDGLDRDMSYALSCRDFKDGGTIVIRKLKVQ